MSKLIQIGPALPAFLGIVYGPPGTKDAQVVSEILTLPSPKKGKPKKPGVPINSKAGRPLLRKKKVT